MEDIKQCCNPFPCPYIGKDKTCEECNCYRDDYWDEVEPQESEGNEKNKKRFENELFMMQTNIFPYKGE